MWVSFHSKKSQLFIFSVPEHSLYAQFWNDWMCHPNFQIHSLTSVFDAFQPNPCFFYCTALTKITNISSRQNLEVCIITTSNTCTVFDTADPGCFSFALRSREHHFVPIRKSLICGNFAPCCAFMSGLLGSSFSFQFWSHHPTQPKLCPCSCHTTTCFGMNLPVSCLQPVSRPWTHLIPKLGEHLHPKQFFWSGTSLTTTLSCQKNWVQANFNPLATICLLGALKIGHSSLAARRSSVLCLLTWMVLKQFNDSRGFRVACQRTLAERIIAILSCACY